MLILAMPFIGGADTSPGAAADSLTACFPRGISMLAGRTLNYSSRSGYAAGNYDFYLAAGYNITPSLLVDLKIYTGTDHLDAGPGVPVSGKFADGGGSLELLYRIAHASPVHPVIAAGYDLATVLSTQSGYNGDGFHIQAGAEYMFLKNFSVELEAVYHYRRYSSLILGGEASDMDQPLIQRVFGINLGVAVHLAITP
jgi:hypothetical protein